MLQINTPFFFKVSFKLLKNLINTPAIIPFIPSNAPFINGCLIETKITDDSEKKQLSTLQNIMYGTTFL